MEITLPFREPPDECLSIGPSQGLVYALDEDIVLKLQFQYEVTQDIEMAHCWDLSLRSFVAMEKELDVYRALHSRPHPNFTRRLVIDESDYLFLERLEPLQRAWPEASRQDRQRWVLEFLSAVCWLEELGFVNGDLAVRNIGIDRTNRLKLFDFGSALPRSHPDFSNDVKRDHFNLATCLHYLLSGVDPFANVHSHEEAVRIRDLVETGRWNVGEGAEKLAVIIQDGWTGKTGSMAFEQLYQEVASILGPCKGDIAPELTESHYRRLESRCQEWLHGAARDPLWKDIDEYVADCRVAGHGPDLDIWR